MNEYDFIKKLEEISSKKITEDNSNLKDVLTNIITILKRTFRIYE